MVCKMQKSCSDRVAPKGSLFLEFLRKAAYDLNEDGPSDLQDGRSTHRNDAQGERSVDVRPKKNRRKYPLIDALDIAHLVFCQ